MGLFGLSPIVWLLVALGTLGGLVHHLLVTRRLDRLAVEERAIPA